MSCYIYSFLLVTDMGTLGMCLHFYCHYSITYGKVNNKFLPIGTLGLLVILVSLIRVTYESVHPVFFGDTEINILFVLNY